MTEPKYEAQEIITRHSFSDSELNETPKPSPPKILLPTPPSDNTSSIIVSNKNETETNLTENIEQTIHKSDQNQANLEKSSKKSEVMMSENNQEIDLANAILGYEQKKKASNIKITDLNEARKNRDKESYILVFLFKPLCFIE